MAKAAAWLKLQNPFEAHLEPTRLNKDGSTMTTIRALTTALVFLVMTFYSVNCSSERAQAETTEALKASVADGQREKQEFITLTEAKIAAFRRSLGEMQARAGNVSSPARVEINKHSGEMERQIEAAEKTLAALKASNNQALD